ncbi:MAG TPA: LptA/OstA family protein, partial [Pyrinomonadaceae bacterium]|nr:LptA/OstA family protein [Pyrinomonadaceae bacterium]
MRGQLSTKTFRYTRALGFPACLLIALLTTAGFAQQPNPVVRKVDNPVTDTPYVNPLQQDQPVRPASKMPPIQAGDSLHTDCANESSTETKEGRVSICEGNVDARIGTYRLQADKVTVYNAKNLLVADGNVVFDQGDQQRITGSHAEWDYRTKTGFFVNATGYTNQTSDGT